MKPGVAPGSYEEHADVKKVEGLKKKDFKETQDIVAFHKMR